MIEGQDCDKAIIQQPMILEVGEKVENGLLRGGNDALRGDLIRAHNAASSASSSSTTSPSNRTSACESYGVGPIVTIAIDPPVRRVTSGSPATGYTSSDVPTHSSRSAPAHKAWASSIACSGSISPN